MAVPEIVLWIKISVVVISQVFLLFYTASAEFNHTEWKRFRKIQIHLRPPVGLVAVPLYSSIVDYCRPDLNDIRIVTSHGSLVPHVIVGCLDSYEPPAEPARISKVARVPGKYTDIFIDKSDKTLTRGVRIDTPSRNFARKVEIRGFDDPGESFVIRMDGLICDLQTPPPVRALKVFHLPNNFQYIHLRILDGGGPPLEIKGIDCYSRALEPEMSRRIELRMIENRPEQSASKGVFIADLGEKRFPVTRLALQSSTREFVKNVKIFGSTAYPAEIAYKIFDGTLFRVRRENAVAEQILAKTMPQNYRYLRIEWFGDGPSLVLDSVEAIGAMRVVIFEYTGETAYLIYYDNPNAKSTAPYGSVSSAYLPQLADYASDLVLSDEHKNLSARARMDNLSKMSGVWAGGRVAVWSIVLIALILLFRAMLGSRSGHSRTRPPSTSGNSQRGQ